MPVEAAVIAVLTVFVAPKLATVVVLVTVNGAVPVATVETRVLPVTAWVDVIAAPVLSVLVDHEVPDGMLA